MKYSAILFLAIILFMSGCNKASRVVSVSVGSGTDGFLEAANPAQVSVSAVQADEAEEVSELKDSGRATDQEIKIVEVPVRLELPVAFAQQAPFANWDEIHGEACEEASMIMVARYFRGQPLSETIMEEELQKLLEWQKNNGYGVDTTAEETAEILKNYFGLKAKLSEDVTVDKIKHELSQGNLIIVPAAGRELNNPNFKRPGPIYHMLVIKGYNGKEFITNDPGTRKGSGYKYFYEILLDAIHDWSHELSEGGMTDAEMAQGRKVMVVAQKP